MFADPQVKHLQVTATVEGRDQRQIEVLAAFDGQAQSRQSLADAGVVRHFRAIEWDVEIYADENALAFEIKVANRELVHD